MSLREAKVKVLETGPLHDFLEKDLSEPSFVGNAIKDIESQGSPSQEDSPKIPDRQRIEIVSLVSS
jgi:hypothetical protein